MRSDLWYKDQSVQARMCDRTSAFHQEMSSALCSLRSTVSEPCDAGGLLPLWGCVEMKRQSLASKDLSTERGGRVLLYEITKSHAKNALCDQRQLFK